MASRFWVGGTGTWDASDTTHWAASTGGAGGQSVPGSADTVTLDGASGGGTVTVNTTVNVTSITMGAFVGTLDFSVNNNSVTVATFSGTGAAVRTLKMGSGAWTLTGTATIWNFANVTNLTFTKGSANITCTATTSTLRTFSANTLTYNDLNVSANTSGGTFTITSGSPTFANLNVTAPNNVLFASGATLTVSSAFTWSGASGTPFSFECASPGNIATISVASGAPTMSWAAVRDLTFAGGATFTATNSLDCGHNTGITITAPATLTGYPASRAFTGM